MTTTQTSYENARLVRPVVLAIDLDETFAQGTGEGRRQLFGLIERSVDDVSLVYMSHDSAENLIQLAASAELPVPEIFMADSGTTVLKGDGTGTIEPIQRNIIQLWPGKDTVRGALQSIEGVTLLDDNAPCRQGFKVSDEETLQKVREKIEDIGCHIDPRGDGEYNVLPFGVEKGSTLGRYLVERNLSPSIVIAFGSAAGDEYLFGRGWRGAVFAHASEKLKEMAGRFHNVHVLEEDGAFGVLRALRLHGWLEMNPAK